MIPTARTDVATAFARDGFVSPVNVLDRFEARAHRDRMEAAEARIGPVHYRPGIHTVLRSAFELATHPRVLDAVRAAIGPDVLLYNATYIVKEPDEGAYVSWHQDLTYWGLSDDTQVSMWLALSPATARTGCMRMVPGSHRTGRRGHRTTRDEANVLYQGQTVDGVDEHRAVDCPLEPGQASFHHGWTLHASRPNTGTDRRIGLNAQFIAPHVRQTKHERDTAMLVCGVDRHHHYACDRPAADEIDLDALERLEALEALYIETVGSDADRVGG